MLLYQPAYLQDVIRYYAAKDVKRGALEDNVPPDRHRIFVLASFQDSANNRRALREGQRELEQNYELVRTERLPQIRLLVYERKEAAR